MIPMDSKFMVLKGWPNQGALDQNEDIADGASLDAGDVVELQANGTVDAVGGTAAANVGFVVRGNVDSLSAEASGKAVVLWSNFIARTQTVAADTYAPGDALMALNGELAKPTGAEPVVAYVKAVHPAAGSEPLSLTVIVR